MKPFIQQDGACVRVGDLRPLCANAKTSRRREFVRGPLQVLEMAGWEWDNGAMCYVDRFGSYVNPQTRPEALRALADYLEGAAPTSPPESEGA